MKYIELKNLARKAFHCKIFQGKKFLARSCKEKITLQDLARKKFPYKILQGTNFLARSCKEQISLQDLTSNCIFTRILQDLCKERIFPQPGSSSNDERTALEVHSNKPGTSWIGATVKVQKEQKYFKASKILFEQLLISTIGKKKRTRDPLGLKGFFAFILPKNIRNQSISASFPSKNKVFLLLCPPEVPITSDLTSKIRI